MKRLVGLDANGVTQLTYQFISLFQYNIRNACHGGRLYGSSVLLPDRGSHLIIIKAGAHALPRGTEPGRQLHAQKLVIGKENDFGSLGKHGQMQLLSIAVHTQIQSTGVHPSSTIVARTQIIKITDNIIA